MPPFVVDRRDMDFVLFEQFDLESLRQFPLYADFGKDDFVAVLDAAQRFITEVMAPASAIADSEGCVLRDGAVTVPKVFEDVYKQWAEGGWIGMTRPPDVGGMGIPLPLSVLITEMGIGACSSFIFFPGLTAAAGHLLENFATDQLKQLIVPKMYSGQWTGTMCLTEPQAGSAVGELTTSATPIEGTNEYLIKGAKQFITCADHQLAENVIHLVLARVPGDPAGTKGISLFAVPKIRFDAEGNLLGSNDVTITSLEEKMGIHGSPTCAMSFGENDDCRGYLIGERSQGIVYMFQMMNEARIVCGIQGAAAANTSYQWALAYARERVQGTKVTDRTSTRQVSILEHPDVRRNLMLCKSISEGIRAMLVQTAFYATWAEHHPDENERGTYRDLVDLLTPICKAYCTDQGFRVTETALQVHGGYGYIREYGVEQQMRDTKIASIYEGTNGIQALDLLGRKMRIKGGALFMTWLQRVISFCEEHQNHPRLKAEVAALSEAKDALGQAAMTIQAQGAQDPEQALLAATPLLEMFGHVETARLLLHQAIVADAALQALAADKGLDEQGLAELRSTHADARFYDGKVRSARFFVHTVLPHAAALGRSIQTGDRSALDVVF